MAEIYKNVTLAHLKGAVGNWLTRGPRDGRGRAAAPASPMPAGRAAVGGGKTFRRKPAESGPGPLAGRTGQGVDLGRADARDGCGSQGGDHAPW